MLDIKWIRENPEALDRALRNRGEPPAAARLIDLDEKRRAHIGELEAAQARRNAASKAIGKAKAAKDEATAARLMAEVADLKTGLQEAEDKGRDLDKGLHDALALIPNVPADDVPVGADESANTEYRRWGEQPALSDPKEHFELAAARGQMDFETAAKLSGSRFVVLKGQLARLSRALGQFMLDLHTNEHGYQEVQPPLLVRDEVLFGTGQLPKFADDQFPTVSLSEGEEKTEGDLKADFWLIPTAEVPLTNLVRDSILDEDTLPLRYVALTPCFRAEAGAAGKDTRGMLRQHQFDKVELVAIAAPEMSAEEHERMLVSAEEVMRRLDLHYRVVTLSTGDMGFAATKTWDIEVWLPGQGAYREISSVSACGDFQARRMAARYRPNNDKATRFVHTFNGSGVAVGRALISVMENYQNSDGSVAVPEVLRPYMGGMETIGN